MKYISLKIYYEEDVSPVRSLKILGLFGNLEMSAVSKLAEEYLLKKEYTVSVNENNMEKVIALFKELKVHYEVLP